MRLYPCAHGFAQRFDIMAGRSTGVDQEVAVHLRHLRAADAQAPAAGGVDQLPRAVIRRVLEGRAAGLFANWLSGFAMVLHLVHPRAYRLRRGNRPAKTRGGENDRGIDAAVAIDELHAGIVEHILFAVAVDAGSFEQNVFGFRTIGACVHAQRAADSAGNAVEKFEPADIGSRRRLRHALVERSSTGADDIAIGTGLAETTRTEADDHARHAAIAHDQIGTDADDIDRKLSWQVGEKIGEIVLV